MKNKEIECCPEKYTFRAIRRFNMLHELVQGRNILFITTKNIDYIRNSQEIRILQENAKSVDFIYSAKDSYPRRLIDIYSSILVEKVKALFKKGKLSKCEVIFLGFAPQLILPFFFRTFRNKLIVIDFFISVYDTMICDRQKYPEGGIVSKLCHYIDEITLKKANYVITDTKAHAAFFIDEFGARPDNVETLYLEADKTIYYPRIQNKPPELTNKFVVLYFGSILPLQGVDVVIDSIRLLKDIDEIFFDIIGPIPEKFNKPIQSNVRYTEWLPQALLAERIAQADLCLAGHFNSSIKKARRTIPGKAYIYEAMNKKMILGDNAANRELFREDSSHVFISLGNSIELSEQIERIMIEHNSRFYLSAL